MPIASIKAVALTNTGRLRAANEDTVAVGTWISANDLNRPKTFQLDPDAPVTAVVADGMGGHAGGEVASRAAAEHLGQRLPEVVTPEDAADALTETNRYIYDVMESGDGAPGMGTTVTGLVIREEGAVVANVGDSRLYRWRAGELTQLSTDDTPGPKLSDGRTAAHTSPMLTQALGGQHVFTPVEPHAELDTPEPGDRYLLATDGLTDLVGPDAIAERLARRGPEPAVAALFRDAMDSGGKDNLSIVLLALDA